MTGGRSVDSIILVEVRWHECGTVYVCMYVCMCVTGFWKTDHLRTFYKPEIQANAKNWKKLTIMFYYY